MKNSIVLVPFPFDDFSSVKVRPALFNARIVEKKLLKLFEIKHAE
ncbi:hypothetical protein [Flavobacterium sp.]|jgi:hypothetical protein